MRWPRSGRAWPRTSGALLTGRPWCLQVGWEQWVHSGGWQGMPCWLVLVALMLLAGLQEAVACHISTCSLPDRVLKPCMHAALRMGAPMQQSASRGAGGEEGLDATSSLTNGSALRSLFEGLTPTPLQHSWWVNPRST